MIEPMWTSATQTTIRGPAFVHRTPLVTPRQALAVTHVGRRRALPPRIAISVTTFQHRFVSGRQGLSASEIWRPCCSKSCMRGRRAYIGHYLFQGQRLVFHVAGCVTCNTVATLHAAFYMELCNLAPCPRWYGHLLGTPTVHGNTSQALRDRHEQRAAGCISGLASLVVVRITRISCIHNYETRGAGYDAPDP